MTTLTTKQKKAKEGMTDQEILQKAIEKAIKNGWKPNVDFEVIEKEWRYLKSHKRWNLYLLGKDTFASLTPSDIIFSHNFAKAFWGNKCPDKECPTGDGDRPHDWVWQNHLKEMVTSENPIKYLEKYI